MELHERVRTNACPSRAMMQSGDEDGIARKLLVRGRCARLCVPLAVPQSRAPALPSCAHDARCWQVSVAGDWDAWYGVRGNAHASRVHARARARA